jgi:uncharacterized protein (TIRG00374 family)
MYRYGFAAVDVEGSVKRFVPVMFASLFVNAVAPTGGVGGAALFVDDAMRRGQSGTRAAVGTILVLLLDLSTMLPFIMAGFAFLYSRGQLKLYILLGLAAFLAFVFALLGALILAAWRPRLLQRRLGSVQQAVSRVGSWFGHPDLLQAEWAESSTGQFQEAVRAIKSRQRDVLVALVVAAFLHLANVAGLYLVFLAFRVQPDLGTVIAGFGMSVVFFVVSIFQGAGVVEVVMILIFKNAGVPEAEAVLIALTFRGLNFWLPILFGFFFVHRVRSFKDGTPATAWEEES